MDLYIGFDSAWTDNPKAPGAICAVGIEDGHQTLFHAPELASFSQALSFIQEHHSRNGITLIALDQPTVVPNLTSMDLPRFSGEALAHLPACFRIELGW
jgi:predicted RNase H-like nuclease